MQYISVTKRYVCKSCGLSLTHQELIELREELRPRLETEENQRQKERKEYLKWWLGRKSSLGETRSVLTIYLGNKLFHLILSKRKRKLA